MRMILRPDWGRGAMRQCFEEGLPKTQPVSSDYKGVGGKAGGVSGGQTRGIPKMRRARRTMSEKEGGVYKLKPKPCIRTLESGRKGTDMIGEGILGEIWVTK